VARAKKNRSISENRAISQRVDELRMQGLPKDRATAAAFRMFREGELSVKIGQQRVIQAKSRQEVALIKAAIAAAARLRKKRQAQKKRQERAEMLLRRAQIEAKKQGEQVTRFDQERIDIERRTR
tara:strand:+ start:365 stop:739 length:375 start_codon:yes stop_codon:yes gene_type:complete